MLEWIRFWITAVLLVCGLISFAAGVIGNCRFYYVMNRMHAGGIGDTQGLFLIVLSIAVSAGTFMDVLKLALLVVFMWTTSPVSSHFLSQIEYYTNPNLYEHVERLNSTSCIREE